MGNAASEEAQRRQVVQQGRQMAQQGRQVAPQRPVAQQERQQVPQQERPVAQQRQVAEQERQRLIDEYEKDKRIREQREAEEREEQAILAKISERRKKFLIKGSYDVVFAIDKILNSQHESDEDKGAEDKEANGKRANEETKEKKSKLKRSVPTWNILYENGSEKELTNPKFEVQSSIVAVMGQYDKGKTFILNLLTGCELASSQEYATKGLSFKRVSHEKKDIILLDTAGISTPVEMTAQDDMQENLAITKATEYFLRDVTMNIAHIIVLVTTEFTSEDQLMLLSLSHQLNEGVDFDESHKKKTVFVVHNFRNVTSEEVALKVWARQVKNVFQNGAEKYEMIWASEDNWYERPNFEEKEVRYLVTPKDQSRHIFLADNNSVYGQKHNPWVIALLLRWLKDLNVTAPYNPLELVKQASNKIFRNYVTNVTKLDFQLEEKKIVPILETGKQPCLTTWDMDAKHGIFNFVFSETGSFSLKFDAAKEDGKYVLLIEMPGIEITIENKDGRQIILPKGLVKREFETFSVQIAGTKATLWNQEAQMVISKRAFGSFANVMKVPPKYNMHSMEATLPKPGLLRLAFLENIDDE